MVIKAESLFTKERVKEMGKSIRIRTMIASVCLSVAMLVLGILTLVNGIKNVKVFDIILGGLFTLFSVWPIWSAIMTSKRNSLAVIGELGVDKNPMTISYVFKEKKVDVTVTQNEVSKTQTIMLKNLTLVRKSKQGIALYLDKNNMYFINSEDFTFGDEEDLIALLCRFDVKIKHR